LFCSKTNQTVTLTVMIADSGEAKIWQIDRPGLLAKIYHVPASHEAEKLAQVKDRVAKLEVMVKRVPKDPNAHQNHISFAWPRSLLKNSGGEVVGFLMPEVENSLDLLKVCTPRMRKSLGIDANWYFLHVVARNIAGIIQAIHDEGYVLGDIKLQNILVNNRALPTIIDTDSFQVVDPVQNKVYRCLVASEGFTPSELIGKNIDSITQSAVHDRFRLGVVIYYLLFGGPPFRGSWQGSGDPPEQVELIRRGFWPYAANSLIHPSNNTIPLDIIHPELQQCFLLCFNDGHFNPSKRPSARVWLGALEVAFNELQSCGKVDSHFYGLSYGHCYWCDRAQNLRIDIFQDNPVVKKTKILSSQYTSQPKIALTPKSAPVQKSVLSGQVQKFFRRSVLIFLGLYGLYCVNALGWWFNKTPEPKPLATPEMDVTPPPPSELPSPVSSNTLISPSSNTSPQLTFDAYLNRGMSKANLGDYQGAISEYDQAIKLKPDYVADYAKAYYNRGLSKHKLEDYQGAISDYNQSIKLNPNYADAYLNRGLFKHKLEDYQGAISDYTQAIKLIPDYADVYYNRGLSKAKLQDDQGAIEDFRQAAKLFQQQNNQTWYQSSIDRLSELVVIMH